MAIRRCPLNQLHLYEKVCVSLFNRTDVSGNRSCNYYEPDTKKCKYDWISTILH